MPGRAQQMTPGQMYEMAPSKFGVPLKVLTNKKALDLAIMKHTWEMQRSSQELAGGERKQHIAGQYGLKEQELRNKVSARSTIEANVLAQAVKMAQDNLIDMDTPEGQAQFRKIYQTLLNQVKGGGEDDASTPKPTNATQPSLMQGINSGYNPRQNIPPQDVNSGKQLDADTARRILQKAGGDKDKARAMARKMGYTL